MKGIFVRATPFVYTSINKKKKSCSPITNAQYLSLTTNSPLCISCLEKENSVYLHCVFGCRYMMICHPWFYMQRPLCWCYHKCYSHPLTRGVGSFTICQNEDEVSTWATILMEWNNSLEATEDSKCDLPKR